MPVRSRDMDYYICRWHVADLRHIARFDFPISDKSIINISTEQVDINMMHIIGTAIFHAYVYDHTRGRTKYIMHVYSSYTKPLIEVRKLRDAEGYSSSEYDKWLRRDSPPESICWADLLALLR